MGIRLEILGLTVEEPGAMLLPAHRLQAILRESPDETLVIETAGPSCLVQGERSEFELGGQDPEEFPDVPTFSADAYHEVSASTLRELIRLTVFAAAVDTGRFALTGVLCELDGQTIRLAATGG